jgi:hypothetical protein
VDGEGRFNSRPPAYLGGYFAFVLPTFTSGAKKGQCNESKSAQPIAQYSAITGSGTVKFS